MFLIPLVYFFRFFSEYISLFCIYCLVWLCIAFFWFNCCYKKPLCEKTETWSLLEWSKEVHLFRVWLTQTLKQWFTLKLPGNYTCKSFIKLTPALQNPVSPQVSPSVAFSYSVTWWVTQIVNHSVSWSISHSVSQSGTQLHSKSASQSVGQLLNQSLCQLVRYTIGYLH